MVLTYGTTQRIRGTGTMAYMSAEKLKQAREQPH